MYTSGHIFQKISPLLFSTPFILWALSLTTETSSLLAADLLVAQKKQPPRFKRKRTSLDKKKKQKKEKKKAKDTKKGTPQKVQQTLLKLGVHSGALVLLWGCRRHFLNPLRERRRRFLSPLRGLSTCNCSQSMQKRSYITTVAKDKISRGNSPKNSVTRNFSKKGKIEKLKKKRREKLNRKRLKKAIKKIKKEKMITKVDLFSNMNRKTFTLSTYIASKACIHWQLDETRVDLWQDRMASAWGNEKEKKRWKKACQKNMWTAIGRTKPTNYRALFSTKYRQNLVKYFITWAQWEGKIKALQQDVSTKIERKKGLKHLYIIIPGHGFNDNTALFLLIWPALSAVKNRASLQWHFISQRQRDTTLLESLHAYKKKKQGYLNSNAMVYLFVDFFALDAIDSPTLHYFKKRNANSNIYLITPYMTWPLLRKFRDGGLRRDHYYYHKEGEGEQREILTPYLHPPTSRQEKQSLQNAPFSLVKSTQIIPSIYFGELLMGPEYGTALTVPYTFSDDRQTLASLLCSSTIHSKGEKWTKNLEIRRSQSFLKEGNTPHEYPKSQEEAIDQYFRDGKHALSKEGSYPRGLPPIPSLYLNTDYHYKDHEGKNIILTTKKSNQKPYKVGTFVFEDSLFPTLRSLRSVKKRKKGKPS